MSTAHQPDLPPVLRPESPTPRDLTELAANFGLEAHGDLAGLALTGITLATSDLRAGEAFVAIQGAKQHGAAYAQAAADKGAVAVITDIAGSAAAASTGLPVLIVDDPREKLGALSAWVYGTGADDDLPLLLATTGTNGKTSVSHLLEGLLDQLGVVTGLSSTAERHIAGEVVVSRLTTPEASEMHALLALMRERGVEAVAVEVSAQALSRHRVDGIVFDVAGFTNLTHDHLDDYADMAEYFEAKLPLFMPDRARRGVVCLDSAYGSAVVERAQIPVVTVGTPAIAADPESAERADWVVTIDDERTTGTRFTLTGPPGTLTTTVRGIGAHMASNAALAVAMLVEGGFEWNRIVTALAQSEGILAYLPGRTELVSDQDGPAVFVDFAHTPDAFEKTLAAVRRVTPGRLLMLFGVSGDRDPTKRFDMGRVAAEGADIVIVTDHHPRFEDPDTVRAALLEGVRSVSPAPEIYEFARPEQAIVEAVSMVREGDAILWAGPGHQNYRDVRGVRVPYSARELARRALRDAGWRVGPPRWEVPYAD